jgi:hypothetical protein
MGLCGTGAVPLFKAALNKSVRVEPVETHSLQINKLPMASTGSARTEGLVQHCLNIMAQHLRFGDGVVIRLSQRCLLSCLLGTKSAETGVRPHLGQRHHGRR